MWAACFERERLVSEHFAYQNDMNAIRSVASACDDRVAAHALRGEAVMTISGGGAGSLFVQADTVCGSCDIADSVYTILHGGYELVHADDHYDLVRTVDQRCDTVAIAVDIDQFAVQSDGVCAHEINITAEGIAVHLLGLLRGLCLATVDQADVVAVFQHIHDTAFR